MKRLLLVVVFVLFSAILGINNVFAGSLNPEQIVKDAYNAMLEGNTKEYYNNVIDKRFNSEEEAISFYNQDFNYDPLQSYEILNNEKQDDGSYKFTVKKTHKSGGVLKTDIIVRKVNESWKLYISDEPDDNDFEVLKERNLYEINDNSTLKSNDNTIQAGMTLVSFSVDIVSYKNTNAFNIPSRGLILDITRQKLNKGTRFAYEVYGYYFDGIRSIGVKEVLGSVSNVTTSLSLSDKPSRGYLRVWGNGTSSGRLAY
ncbi:hypothetical protein DX933_08070 [Ornithinibacillus gellani]|uniref:hypothetical protein n=1 Tax=Ornithinibacillus gellani TaxID=2293253 RepID=UPI000F47D314|nr:hypothetical protein [Ornithinibacillus gellani]TQS75111.1 hypothetical protein DX933_08070 [Ornithinibacillus gellani]